MILRPRRAFALYVLAHGAGAGMRHPWMEAIAQALAARRVATWRWEMPYLREGRKRPDPPAVATAAVREAVAAARRAARGLPIVAGGKSFGGRMTSTAEADAPLGVRGLVFLGFPLHPANAPATKRADHLDRVKVPMLFVQGDRDALAELPLLAPIVERIGADLRVIEGADHGFAVPRRSGRDPIAEVADAVAGWLAALTRSS